MRDTDHPRSARDFPGAAFRPLLLGYSGAANTGADVRVIEMLRQFERMFSHVSFQPVLLASGDAFDHPHLQAVRKMHMTSYFPDLLEEARGACTGVIACEGSMFTSTFSDILSGMFAGGLGYAAASGHLSVGYGAEAARMTPNLEDFVSSVCAKSLIIARSGESLKKLLALGLRCKAGADPAWTFEPSSPTALELLRTNGWNGASPVAVLCPINPFHWPVVIDVKRAAAVVASGIEDDRQHDALSFYSWSVEADRKYARYLSGFADLVQWLQKKDYFPILVGMQDMDKRSCGDLNKLLKTPLPVFARGDHDIDDITGLLHHAMLIVSSRFHATVIGMAAGRPSVGVSMDSRIDSLFSENGLGGWLLPCDDDYLGERLIDRASQIERERDALAEKYGRLTAHQIRAFGQMGVHLMDEITATYSDFPQSSITKNWDACLPPLSPRLEGFLSQYASAAEDDE